MRGGPARSVIRLAVLLLFVASAHASTVAFVTLADWSGVDCDAVPASAPVCRMRTHEDAAALDAMLQAGTSVRGDGNQLVFAYRGRADSITLIGGLTYPLSRVRGTDLWALRLRVHDLDRLLLSYRFLLDDTYKLGAEAERWRGPDAPAAPVEATSLSGHVDVHQITSAALAAPRPVSVYVPPEIDAQPLAAVVYAADGASLDTLARVIDPLIAAGTLPRVLLVGLHPADDGRERQHEYVAALGRKNGRFAAHERFFIDEVMPFAERKYGAPDAPRQRMLFGFSNGADWAIATALRHPEQFGRVIAFSVAWNVRIDAPERLRGLAFHLGVGTLDGDFQRNTREIDALLTRLRVDHTLQEAVAGHDMALWKQLLPEALRRSLTE